MNQKRRFTKTHFWRERLKKVESPDTTFFSDNFPIIMKKAAGMVVQDVDNNRYLDFTSCFGVLALGHRSPVALRALRTQASQLIHGMGDVHPSQTKVLLLEKLAQMTPFQQAKSVLSQSGGEAVESAMKTAILVTGGRSEFLSFSGGYHGLHFGPLGLNDRECFTEGFRSYLGQRNYVLPFPYFPEEKLDFVDLKKHSLVPANEVLTLLEDQLKTRKYAGLILEPLQGRGGKRRFSVAFMHILRELCTKYGTLLIFDEIYTGFGRTGKMFALEHYKVIPDLLCLGKALGGGLPLSACVGDCLDAWGKSQGEARQTSTFLGHPLACAVGLATLQEIQKKLPLFCRQLPAIEEEFNLFFAKMTSLGLEQKFPCLLRGEGFARGLWFYRAEEGFAARLAEDLLGQGFLILPEGPRGDVLSFCAPLVAKPTDYHRILAAILTRLVHYSEA